MMGYQTWRWNGEGFDRSLWLSDAKVKETVALHEPQGDVQWLGNDVFTIRIELAVYLFVPQYKYM